MTRIFSPKFSNKKIIIEYFMLSPGFWLFIRFLVSLHNLPVTTTVTFLEEPLSFFSITISVLCLTIETVMVTLKKGSFYYNYFVMVDAPFQEPSLRTVSVMLTFSYSEEGSKNTSLCFREVQHI